MQTATFGAGCFWCTEAIFQTIKGVEAVRSGYMGGEVKHPTFMEISSGNTGHAEVVEIIFDENIISYEELLLLFSKPTIQHAQITGEMKTDHHSDQ